ncbi:hypothetical protein GF323_06270 [Candidatus Woesearchaeota archaeon]|nr:hypothetical protein [Candidatus Woesearchaeota archaeon]
MKFAHLADCHIGSWRDPLLADLNIKAFERAIDISIQENLDFVIIAGDLFNTSLPSLDYLKKATKKLKQLKDSSIPCYLIPGSHDFSPSGKTMLDVLEHAGLCINVAKGEEVEGKLKLNFTIDKKTGVKITGLLGKKGGLEKNYYAALLREPLEQEPGYKIFLFHSLLTELKPKELEKSDSQPMSLLPKNFDYYAGGHPHFIFSEKIENYGIISYPGPIFPNSFKELEDLQHGGFYIIEGNNAEWVPIKLYDVVNIRIDVGHKTVEQVESLLKKKIEENDFNNKVVAIRMKGILESGKPSDINFREFYNKLKEKGAYVILKNSSALTSREFEDIKIEVSNTNKLENSLIEEQISKGDLQDIDAFEFTKYLIKVLDTSKQEGERAYDFEKRIKEEIDRMVN